MKALLNAFRRAHKMARLAGLEETFGPLVGLPDKALAANSGPWEEQLLAQALLVLRKKGLPEPGQTPSVLFANMVTALKTCKEASDVDSDHPGRDKPAA